MGPVGGPRAMERTLYEGGKTPDRVLVVVQQSIGATGQAVSARRTSPEGSLSCDSGPPQDQETLGALVGEAETGAPLPGDCRLGTDQALSGRKRLPASGGHPPWGLVPVARRVRRGRSRATGRSVGVLVGAPGGAHGGCTAWRGALGGLWDGHPAPGAAPTAPCRSAEVCFLGFRGAVHAGRGAIDAYGGPVGGGSTCTGALSGADRHGRGPCRGRSMPTGALSGADRPVRGPCRGGMAMDGGPVGGARCLRGPSRGEFRLYGGPVGGDRRLGGPGGGGFASTGALSGAIGMDGGPVGGGSACTGALSGADRIHQVPLRGVGDRQLHDVGVVGPPMWALRGVVGTDFVVWSPLRRRPRGRSSR